MTESIDLNTKAELGWPDFLVYLKWRPFSAPDVKEDRKNRDGVNKGHDLNFQLDFYQQTKKAVGKFDLRNLLLVV